MGAALPTGTGEIDEAGNSVDTLIRRKLNGAVWELETWLCVAGHQPMKTLQAMPYATSGAAGLLVLWHYLIVPPPFGTPQDAYTVELEGTDMSIDAWPWEPV